MQRTRSGHPTSLLLLCPTVHQHNSRLTKLLQFFITTKTINILQFRISLYHLFLTDFSTKSNHFLKYQKKAIFILLLIMLVVVTSIFNLVQF